MWSSPLLFQRTKENSSWFLCAKLVLKPRKLTACCCRFCIGIDTVHNFVLGNDISFPSGSGIQNGSDTGTFKKGLRPYFYGLERIPRQCGGLTSLETAFVANFQAHDSDQENVTIEHFVEAKAYFWNIPTPSGRMKNPPERWMVALKGGGVALGSEFKAKGSHVALGYAH